jgi:hypothetical protein
LGSADLTRSLVVVEKASEAKPRQRPDGFIAPERLYTTEGVNLAIGLARESLRSARASGIVKPIKVGSHLYYEGAEIIAWLRSHKG